MNHTALERYDMGRGVVAFSTTRRPGHSEGPYAAFNINPYCGDTPGAVSRNRALLCQWLGISDDHLIMTHQTHQTRIARIDQQFFALSADDKTASLEGIDALMTDVSDVCIGVSTADCIPLLLYDADSRAVCAIHAGWRGTVARIAQSAVAAMAATYGTSPSCLVAQIGPGISLDSFEVGDEVYDAFYAAGFDMPAISGRYPVCGQSGREHKWHINLPECNRRQLVAAGLAPGNIAVSSVCTFQHADSFFSARRLGIQSGRIFTGIMLQA